MAIFAEAEMPEGEANAKVEIAHVLTMDVVEYSKLLITEQARVIAELTNIDIANVDAAATAIAENADLALGAKVRMSENVIAKNGIPCVD